MKLSSSFLFSHFRSEAYYFAFVQLVLAVRPLLARAPGQRLRGHERPDGPEGHSLYRHRVDGCTSSVYGKKRRAAQNPPERGLPGGEKSEALEALGSHWGQGGAGARWQGAPPGGSVGSPH